MIFELPQTWYTSRSHAERSKHWIKRLDRVDQTKSNGYAFVGKFVNWGGMEEAPVGTYYLSFQEDRRGSGKLDNIAVELWHVADDGLTPVKDWELGSQVGWALKVRDEIADLISGEPSREELLKERATLEERIKEIDRLLVEKSPD